MWSSNITSKNLSNGELKIEVAFANGSQKFTKEYNVSSINELNRRIRNELERLNALETEVTAVTVGVYTPTEETVVEETQAEKDERAWFREFAKLERFTRLKELGGMPVAWEADLAALQQKVQTDAKKIYVKNM